MPASSQAPKFTVFDPQHYDEVPRTRFLDWIDAITVDVVNYPDRDRLYEALTGMQVAAWAESVEDIDRARELFKAEYIVKGQALPLGSEVPTFTFRVGGISRIMTHQIVRNRLGVVYSQKGTANQDVRHQDVLVPRAYNRPGEEDHLERYVRYHLMFKDNYAFDMDSRRHSMMAARYPMPHSLAQFIFVNINLASLTGLVAKRLCTCEAIEYNRIATLMVEGVANHFPEFAPMFKAACDTPAGCYYVKTFGTPIGYTLHFPDEKHARGRDWNPENYLHQATRDDLVGGPVFETREYLGWERVR